MSTYRVAGQKSVPKVWVIPAELLHLQLRPAQLLNRGEDRLQLIGLDQRQPPHGVGQTNTFRVLALVCCKPTTPTPTLHEASPR